MLRKRTHDCTKRYVDYKVLNVGAGHRQLNYKADKAIRTLH